MDFAPRGGNTASRDEAAAVTEGDRAALTAVEDPLFGAEGPDPAGVGVDQHPQHHPRAAGVLCRGDADGLLAALDMGPSGTCGDILGACGDDEGRGGAADGRQQFAGRRHEQCGREGVVLLLRAGAGLGRAPAGS